MIRGMWCPTGEPPRLCTSTLGSSADEPKGGSAALAWACAALACVTEPRLGEFSAQQLVDTAWAFAKMGQRGRFVGEQTEHSAGGQAEQRKKKSDHSRC